MGHAQFKHICDWFQEEEIDDLAGQVQLLEQSKIKLEMSMAATKKEHRRELSLKVGWNHRHLIYSLLPQTSNSTSHPQTSII
jgi:hypothetical protein